MRTTNTSAQNASGKRDTRRRNKNILQRAIIALVATVIPTVLSALGVVEKQ